MENIKNKSNKDLIKFMIYSAFKVLQNKHDNNLLEERVNVEDELYIRGGYYFLKNKLNEKDLKEVELYQKKLNLELKNKRN